MNNPFPPELRTMAVVPRWAILRTSMQQSVAEHSYFVMMYAMMVAKVIKWTGPLDYLLVNAGMHDNDETVSGDIVGTVRSVILDKEATEEFLSAKTEERMGGLIHAYYEMEDGVPDALIKEADRIVKAADVLEATLFLIDNVKMGNQMMGPALEGGKRSLEAAWRALPADKEFLDKTWQTIVLPSIAEHYERGGRGVAPGVYI